MDETLTINKNLVAEALTEALNKANVPQRQHLMVVQALQRRMEEHSRDMQSHQKIMQEHERQNAHHDSLNEEHERQIEDWDSTSRHLLSIEHIKGEQGENGMDGRDGFDGKDADEEAIKSSILEVLPALIPEPIPGKDAEFDQQALIKAVIKEIQNSKALDLTHIKGAQKFIKDGVSYKIEELMHGAGSNTGGSFSVLVPTGIVNGVNRTFTFTKAPGIISIDNGNLMNQVSSDGTVNWTIVGTTVTMSQAPNFNIYGF